MAEEAQNTEGQVEEKKSGAMKWIIIGVVAMLVVAGGSVGLTVMLLGNQAPVAEVEPEPVILPFEYVATPKPFTVNLLQGKRQHVLQVRVFFQVRGDDAKDAVKQHMPLLQNELLNKIALADVTQIKTPEGKKVLKDTLLEAAQTVMTEQSGVASVEQILFTNFVLQ